MLAPASDASGDDKQLVTLYPTMRFTRSSRFRREIITGSYSALLAAPVKSAGGVPEATTLPSDSAMESGESVNTSRPIEGPWYLPFSQRLAT
jgi:hypothetical protein